ncbi:unnamed protein product [Didymodactylos carnosus]|uniref:HEAT repeat domain-containing protein n=2 Tax=Didymodactylos carnosus TaxID=1234261 RepID=A0A8S2JTJ9_9BILA|nr:unnamed protein product [Didymodactylos carnosus]CAF3813823.1 unnamed protein product [Didymodactylos carnosus]
MDPFWSAIQSEPLDLVGLRNIKVLLECIDDSGDSLGFPQHADQDEQMKLQTYITVSKVTLLNPQPKLIFLLLAALGDKNDDVRNSVCEALEEMGEKAATNEVIDRLVYALGDEEWCVRNRACEALGNMGEKAATNEVIERLVNALGDETYGVRYCACEALGNMDEKSVTNEVIERLVNALGDRCIEDEPAARALEWAVCSWDVMKQLD